jgi:alpha-amylase
MEIGKKYANRIFVDITGNRREKVKINKDGWGEFLVADKSVSIWIPKTSLPLLH